MILIEIVRTELWVIEIPPKATLSFENIAGTGWNRNTVYKDFGFSEFYDSEDFVDPSYYRCYISD